MWVFFIMRLNFLSYGSNYSEVKSHPFSCLSAKTFILFAQAVKGLKKPFCFFQSQSVNIAHAHQILFEIAVSGFVTWCSSLCKFCFLSSPLRWTYEHDIYLGREILLIKPYQYNPESKESGNAWSSIADNKISEVQFDANQKSVRDQCRYLLEKHQK